MINLLSFSDFFSYQLKALELTLDCRITACLVTSHGAIRCATKKCDLFELAICYVSEDEIVLLSLAQTYSNVLKRTGLVTRKRREEKVNKKCDSSKM